MRQACVKVSEMGVAGRHILYLGAAIIMGGPAIAESAPVSATPQSALSAFDETTALAGKAIHDDRSQALDALARASLSMSSPAFTDAPVKHDIALNHSVAMGQGAVQAMEGPRGLVEQAPSTPPVTEDEAATSAPPLTIAGVDENSAQARRRGPLKFRSERDAFRTGIRDYYSGDKAGAVQALEYAARRGHSPAQWKLGRMYAEGDGVGHDDLKAFEYFSRVIEDGEEGSSSRTRRFVSNAYVALGGYYLDGIEGSYVNKDERRARNMFQHAASYFGDPDAQYNLARLCLAGQGGPRDAQLAARWLHLAAEKNHAPSQALLGHLLLTGQDNVKQQMPRGLMWLTIARNAADPSKDAWIIEMYDQAIALVSERERKLAQAYLDQRARK